ncbi:MAG: hypothetical protein PHT60_04285 [Acidiphilium sp.]|nr:hypothetical protein [Acidiphilium sp.]MDD4934978.1 hypothetical protein [Acidiphilium sp.]
MEETDSLILARLAGEWQYLVKAGLSVALGGLAAARATAQFAIAEHFSIEARFAWVAAMGGDAPPSLGQLRGIWEALAPYWQEAVPDLSDQEALNCVALWPLIGSTESIMETGGDIRLLRDPQSDLNGYGCSHRPRPWAITFASSTASSVSERGYEAADRARLRLTAKLLQTGDRGTLQAEATAVRRAIGRGFGVPRGGAVVLAASGTDSELLTLALSHLAAANYPITTILLAPEETGTGVPMAAIGRHFAVDTANGHDVSRAAPIEGFRADTILVAIPLRDDDGQVRLPDAVEMDIRDAVTTAVAAGRRVILHALDLSKTGLLAPSMDLLRDLRTNFKGELDIVVDACQMRIAPERIRDYLALDAVVQITGSKFLTGPPFAGAALVPPAIAARLASGMLPAGLDAYFGQGEWPRGAAAAQNLPSGANYGLLLRWRAALAEYRVFAVVDNERKTAVIERFQATVNCVIEQHGIFVLQTVPPLRRDGDLWDLRRTVFAFAVKSPEQSGRLLDPVAMRQLYRWLNADCSALFDSAEDRRVAARICHIGQPVALPDGNGGQTGWLRVSAGARLISGEPSHRGLAVERRLDREMDDLASVFDKIVLLHAHWAQVEVANPAPRYR